MMLTEAYQLLTRLDYKLTETKNYDLYNTYLYSNGKVLVKLEEALSYSLDGKVNSIYVSALLRGAYKDLHRFFYVHSLGGFAPYQENENQLIIDFDLQASFHPMHSLAVFEHLLSQIEKFEVRPGAPRIWCPIEVKSSEVCL